MPGFTGDLDVDLERGLAECASKTIMTHILEKGFHGQRKTIKVHLQAVARSASPSPTGRTDRAGGRFVFFADPDGNKWALQQLPPRG